MHRRQVLKGLAAMSASGLFRRTVAPRVGYAAITWGSNDNAAINDIADLDYRGIQLRATTLASWESRPDALRELLAAKELTFVALSSGLVRLDPQHEAADLALHLRHARFLRDAGGLYLQVVDERPVGRPPASADYTRMGRLLTELGRRVADLGVSLGYHNHMGNLGQSPEDVARVLDAADARYVKLQLDTAHWQAAGGDPVGAIAQYRERLLFMHLKDLAAPSAAARGPRFVELGKGTVDVKGIVRALAAADWNGWIIVELDSVPDAGRTPRDCALTSRQYLQSIGLVP
ncbi:MAG: TIM barrel protein [Gemmatimonadaceae bacterium]|nr:TIM barrel protein [Gemmatimonadaceae bacterium]